MPTKFYAQLLALLLFVTACTSPSAQNETSIDKAAVTATTEAVPVPIQGDLLFIEFFAGT